MAALRGGGDRAYQPRAAAGLFPVAGVTPARAAWQLAERAEPYLVRRAGLAGGAVGRYRGAPVVAQPGDEEERWLQPGDDHHHQHHDPDRGVVGDVAVDPGESGVDITALVASLGVGGIAVALAVQTVLSDVFASLSIGVDKPFEIGDFVVFGEVAGTIEHIGLKTTRIRSLSGEQVVCANADLLRQIVHNYKRMNTRRIVFKFGINYDTPSDKVREVAERVGDIIRATPKTRFDGRISSVSTKAS